MRIRLTQIQTPAQSTAPSNPTEDDIYLDDGTNTASGVLGLRYYNGSAWEDIGGGLAGTVVSVPIAGQYQITDIRLAADLSMIVEYDDTPV